MKPEGSLHLSSLSQNGETRSRNKADFLPCLEIDADLATEEPLIQALILEASVIVNILKPGNAKIFHDEVFASAMHLELCMFDRDSVL